MNTQVLRVACGLLVVLMLGACATPRSAATIDAANADSLRQQAQVVFKNALDALENQHYPAAVTGFERVLVIDPTLTSPRFNLALTWQRAGQLDKSMTAVDELLQRQPTHVAAQNLKATLLQQLGKIQQSRQVLEGLVTASAFPAAHYNLAVLCDVYLSDLSCARYHFEEYQRLRPDDDKRVTAWLADLYNRDKESPAYAN